MTRSDHTRDVEPVADPPGGDTVSDRLSDRVYRVSGNSMNGTFQRGQLLLMDKDPDAAISPGDVVVFRRGDQLVCHRIVALSDDGVFITRGDAMVHNDPEPVLRSEIVGKVAGVLSGGTLNDMRHGSVGLAYARKRRLRVRMRYFLSRAYTLLGRPWDRFRARSIRHDD